MREGVEGQLELSPSLLTVCGGSWWHCMGTGGGSAYAHDCVLHRWAMGRLHAVRWCCPRSSGGPVPASAAS